VINFPNFSLTEYNSMSTETCGIHPLQQSSIKVVTKYNTSNDSCSGYEEEPYNYFVFVDFCLQQYRFEKASEVTRDLRTMSKN